MPESLGYHRLSERQKEVLRLIWHGYRPKEIAQLLADVKTISAVEGRLRTARAALGVTSNGDAARIVAEHESNVGNAVYAPSDVPCLGDLGDAEPEPAPSVQEVRTPFEVVDLNREGKRNDLIPEQLGRLVLRVGLLSLGVSALLIVMIVVSAVVRAIYQGHPVTISM